jgi:single-strand DNA-binding protein
MSEEVFYLMASFNKVMLLGNLGRDPELRYTAQGKPVANFSLATTDRWTSKDGEKQQRTEWHYIVLWGRQAEVAHQYLKKGSSCFIEGRITNRSWDDKDGVKHYRTEIEGLGLQLMSGGGRSEPPPQPDEYFDSFPDTAADRAASPAPDSSPPDSSGTGGDDLPF